MKNVLYTLLILMIFSACGREAKNYDQIATDLCSCMRPLADMNSRIKKLVEEGKTQEVAVLFTEIERLSTEGETCAKSLEEKYGKVEGKEEEKTTTALKKHCPDIAKMLAQSKSLEQ